jgi:hypothetical protein
MKKEAFSQLIQKFLQSNVLLYCVIFLLALKIIISVISVNFLENIFFADITKNALVNMLNQTRGNSGLLALTENSKLDRAAQMKAEDMVQKEYFSHISPQGLTPWYWFLQSGYNYKYAGENLAIGFYDSSEAFNAWLNSPSHRENMLNKNYKEVGTAVLQGFGENNAFVVVQLFGSLKPEEIPVKVNNNTDILPENNEDIVQQENPIQENPIAEDTNPSPVTPEDSKKVLQGSTVSGSLEPLTNNSTRDLRAKILNFIAYSYNIAIQDVIYGVLMIITGALLFILIFDFNALVQKKFIFRAFIVIILLSFTALFNRELVISLIPHQIII